MYVRPLARTVELALPGLAIGMVRTVPQPVVHPCPPSPKKTVVPSVVTEIGPSNPDVSVVAVPPL